MWWDQLVENLKIFFNQPVVIAGVTIGTIGVLLFTIIAKTSIGRKSLKKLKEGIAHLQAKHDAVVQECEKFKELTENKIADLVNQYETKLALVVNEKQELEKLVFEIADNIHNEKVKGVVKDYIKKTQEKEVEIETIVTEKLADYKEQLINYKAELENIYKEQIEQIKSQFLGDKEDGKDTNGTQEEIQEME